MDRRQAVQTAAAAALALPLAANAYCDNAGIKCTTDQINKNAAPIVSQSVIYACSMLLPSDLVSIPQITIFDHRGCAEHVNKEYTGPKAGNENDEMALKVIQAPSYMCTFRPRTPCAEEYDCSFIFWHGFGIAGLTPRIMKSEASDSRSARHSVHDVLTTKDCSVCECRACRCARQSYTQICLSSFS